jgi:hypothetical protein
VIVNLGIAPTRIQFVSPGDLIFNEGLAPAYVDTIIGNVLQAPKSSAVPVAPGSTVQWAGQPGMLYGVDPTGSAPGVGVTSQSGLPFPAPIVSGQNLVIPGIQSPNFVTGVSGWRINRDGSAEFNNLEIRGTFMGSQYIANVNGIFFYNGTPGLGTLFLAITSAPFPGINDPYGNTVPSGGLTLGQWSGTGVLQQAALIDRAGHFFTQDSTTAENILGFPEFGAIGSFGAGGVPTWVGSEIAGNNSYYGFSDVWGPGLNGPIAAWHPGTPPVTVETPQTLALTNAWAGSGNGVNGFTYELLATGVVHLEWDLQSPNNNPGNIGTLPTGYRPSSGKNIVSGWYGTGPVAYNDQYTPHFEVNTNGTITPAGIFVATIALFGTADFHL